MKTRQIFSIVLTAVLVCFLASPSYAGKRLKKANAKIAKLENRNRSLTDQLSDCRDTSAMLGASILQLQERSRQLIVQLQDQKTSNEQVLNRLKDLSVLSGTQAESINRFLETMGAKDAYIRDLQTAMARKDSLTMALVVNLKGAIGDLDDKDINIKIDKGVVYIDISDKMLFKSGRYEVTDRAREVLGKVARVLVAHPDIEFMVEGHTDNVAYREGVLLDNWDLSVKRATSIVRILQNEYSIPPARMAAAGRSEYVPVAANTTDDGKAANRRTRIVILPQLDQFFTLLAKPKS